jgi:hypothetical protein
MMPVHDADRLIGVEIAEQRRVRAIADRARDIVHHMLLGDSDDDDDCAGCTLHPNTTELAAIMCAVKSIECCFACNTADGITCADVHDSGNVALAVGDTHAAWERLQVAGGVDWRASPELTDAWLTLLECLDRIKPIAEDGPPRE